MVDVKILCLNVVYYVLYVIHFSDVDPGCFVCGAYLVECTAKSYVVTAHLSYSGH